MVPTIHTSDDSLVPVNSGTNQSGLKLQISLEGKYKHCCVGASSTNHKYHLRTNSQISLEK
jgi:hypothetical protein